LPLKIGLYLKNVNYEEYYIVLMLNNWSDRRIRNIFKHVIPLIFKKKNTCSKVEKIAE